MKIITRSLFLSLAMAMSILGVHECYAKEKGSLDLSDFSKIPLMDQGRIKPMDSFARHYLKGFCARETIKKTPAIEWLAELLFDPEKAASRPVFNIPNPAVVDALDLERRPDHRYSHQEVSTAISGHFKTWHALFLKSKEDLTLEQEQLLALYNKTRAYEDISRSLSMTFAQIEVPPGILSESFGVPEGTKLPYMQVAKKRMAIQDLAQTLGDSDEGRTVAQFEARISDIDRDKNSELFRIYPPQWDHQPEDWLSPWTIGQKGYGSPQTAYTQRLFLEMVAAYRAGDAPRWAYLSRQLRESLQKMSERKVPARLLSLEVFYNRAALFSKCLIFYLSAFLVALVGFLFRPRTMRKLAILLVCFGLGVHASGIVIRMTIMRRPPVTSLYESIIFVAFIVAFFGILLEWRKKNGIGLIIASSMATALHFIGLRYSAEGDTLGMLQAVLNTNFWLATHVVMVTIGYGCCLVGGVLGHVYLIYRLIRGRDQERLRDLYQNLQGVTIVAMFFAILGTILGGIWADQSWGRFWGWDPKENGALLIVLWLAWLVHGRLIGRIGELGYATGMVCTNIIVALAWFGVNLLSVGLHSYGFTNNAALNLGLFCGFELLFAAGCYIKIRFLNEQAR